MKLENALYGFLVDNEICTENEVNLVTDINGYSEETLLDILFARTGLRSYEQALNEGYQGTDELNEYYDI